MLETEVAGTLDATYHKMHLHNPNLIADFNQDGNTYLKNNSSALRTPKASQSNLLIARTISQRYYKDGSENLIQTKNNDIVVSELRQSGFRQHRSDGLVPTLTQKMGTGGNNVPMILKRHRSDEIRNHGQIVPTLTESHEHYGGANPPLVVMSVLTPDREKKRQHGRRFKDNGEEMFTLTGQDIHGVAILSHSPRTNDPKLGGSGPLISDEHCFTVDSTPHNLIEGMRIRRLTPTECERLQSFPDDFSAKGIDKDGVEVAISDTQRYKQMGNSLTTSVVTFIGKRLARANTNLLK